MYYIVSFILYIIQYGDTTLHKACSRGDHNTVDLLIRAGANIDIANNVSLWHDNVCHLIYLSREKNNKIGNVLYK